MEGRWGKKLGKSGRMKKKWMSLNVTRVSTAPTASATASATAMSLSRGSLAGATASPADAPTVTVTATERGKRKAGKVEERAVEGELEKILGRGWRKKKKGMSLNVARVSAAPSAASATASATASVTAHAPATASAADASADRVGRRRRKGAMSLSRNGMVQASAASAVSPSTAVRGKTRAGRGEKREVEGG
jgi:hypothetical protein